MNQGIQWVTRWNLNGNIRINNFSFSAGVNLLSLNKATVWNRNGSNDRLVIHYKDQKYYLSELEYSSVPEPSVKELDVELKYLGIRVPVYVNYRFGKSRLQPLVGTGVSFMYTLHESNHFIYPYFASEFGKTFPDFYMGFQARGGFQYKINDRLNAFATINYDFSANPNVNKIDRLKINSFGVNLGLQF